jgi:hypothetical protein
MNKPKFLLDIYIENYKDSIDLFKNELFKNGILSKDYDNLLLLYTKYNSLIISELQRECRSLIFDKNTFKIISYSCETPLLNNNGCEYLNDNNNIISICYEGTYISIFNYNNKWYLSTRRCLQNQDSDIKCKHYDMFIEIINSMGFENFNDFCNTLNKNKSYYYTLIHYNNKHIIDYTDIFGDNYMKLCLASIRNNMLCEENIYINPIYSNDCYTSTCFITDLNYNLNNFFRSNQIVYDKSLCEGVIIRSFDPVMNKYKLIKLQYLTYQFHQHKINNLYISLLFLYQNNKLNDYILYYNLYQNININNISYNTTSLITKVFEVLGLELYDLYNNLWEKINDDNQKLIYIQKNKDLYDKLPSNYKTILYNIRGIYFKSNNIIMKPIINYLKQIDVKKLCSLLKSRSTIINIYNFISITDINYNANSDLCNLFTQLI